MLIRYWSSFPFRVQVSRSAGVQPSSRDHRSRGVRGGLRQRWRDVARTRRVSLQSTTGAKIRSLGVSGCRPPHLLVMTGQLKVNIPFATDCGGVRGRARVTGFDRASDRVGGRTAPLRYYHKPTPVTPAWESPTLPGRSGDVENRFDLF